MHIYPYLILNGTTEEAMTFYHEVLGGSLDLHRFSEMPEPHENLSADDMNRIMHAQLRCDEAVLMASDGCPSQPVPAMDGFSVAVFFNDIARAKNVFDTLGQGGSVIMPWEPTFWADGFGMLRDRFGVVWMVSSGPDQ